MFVCVCVVCIIYRSFYSEEYWYVFVLFACWLFLFLLCSYNCLFGVFVLFSLPPLYSELVVVIIELEMCHATANANRPFKSNDWVISNNFQEADTILRTRSVGMSCSNFTGSTPCTTTCIVQECDFVTCFSSWLWFNMNKKLAPRQSLIHIFFLSLSLSLHY